MKNGEHDLLSKVDIYSPHDQLIVLTRDIYAPDTLGAYYFPELLEGRTRPNIFTTSALPFTERIKQLLAERNISNLDELFQMPHEALDTLSTKISSMVYSDKLQTTIDRLANQYAITPHGNLLGAILGEQQGPVEPEDESELRQIIESTIDNSEHINSRAKQIISQRFGLEDSLPCTFEEIGHELNISRERVRQIEQWVLAKLRHDCRNLGELWKYSTFPINSIGRRLGITYRLDTPPIATMLSEFNLSNEANHELRDYIDTRRLPPQPKAMYDGTLYGERKYLNKWRNFESKDGEAKARSENLLSLNKKEPGLTKAIVELLPQLKSALVFGNLFPEQSGLEEGNNLMLNMPVNELGLSIRAINELHQQKRHDEIGRGDVNRLGFWVKSLQSDSPETTPVSLRTATELGVAMSRLAYYLGVIANELES